MRGLTDYAQKKMPTMGFCCMGQFYIVTADRKDPIQDEVELTISDASGRKLIFDTEMKKITLLTMVKQLLGIFASYHYAQECDARQWRKEVDRWIQGVPDEMFLKTKWVNMEQLMDREQVIYAMRMLMDMAVMIDNNGVDKELTQR